MFQEGIKYASFGGVPSQNLIFFDNKRIIKNKELFSMFQNYSVFTGLCSHAWLSSVRQSVTRFESYFSPEDFSEVFINEKLLLQYYISIIITDTDIIVLQTSSDITYCAIFNMPILPEACIQAYAVNIVSCCIREIAAITETIKQFYLGSSTKTKYAKEQIICLLQNLLHELKWHFFMTLTLPSPVEIFGNVFTVDQT